MSDGLQIVTEDLPKTCAGTVETRAHGTGAEVEHGGDLARLQLLPGTEHEQLPVGRPESAQGGEHDGSAYDVAAVIGDDGHLQALPQALAQAMSPAITASQGEKAVPPVAGRPFARSRRTQSVTAWLLDFTVGLAGRLVRARAPGDAALVRALPLIRSVLRESV